jgi:Ca-activated chloride channel family protein
MRGLGFVKGHTRSGKARRPAPPQQAFAGRIDDESLAEDIVVSGEFKVRSDISYNKPTQTNADPLSTFSIDVDTAAYSIARRSLMANQSPTPSLVRVEEMINYFKYNYDAPSNKPFAIQFDGARSPVDNSKHILRVGIQSKKVSKQNRLPSNIVFLVDTSCSMTSPDKLDLAKSSIRIAVENLGERDKVAITTYAGGVSLVLPPTSASQTHKIFKALDRLQSSGGTAMSSGMQMAYQQAALMLRPETNTRVVVLSDGDANIGAIGHRQMLKQIKGYVSEGVRMTTIGYGDGNYKDETMEQLANKGNGNYYYIDSPRMAARVFGRDLTQMLQDVAQDVKIQVEFNPKTVKNYRLVGYENRKVADQDFRNDDVDAGEIGAGHQVTALYELTLKEGASNKSELATVRVRAKKPMERKAKETARRVEVGRVQPLFSDSPDDFQFATAVMGGAELLRNSPHAQAWNFDRVLSILDDAAVSDSDRQEFVKLMKIAKRLAPSRSDRFSSRQ